MTEKVTTALKTPTHITRKLPGGEVAESWLKQIVVSGSIRIDETIADFRWMYKAEVSFDMTVVESGQAPVPFLSSSAAQIAKDGSKRRHSLNPFPPGLKSGYLRRPDVIIVRNLAMRWPGRGNIDRDGAAHIDNLLRLVEIKFPGDGWGKGQEEDYQVIAGGTDRMSVLDVSDCDGDLDKAKQRAREGSGALYPSTLPVPLPAQSGAGPGRGRGGTPVRVPVRSTQPIAEKVWYEPWLNELDHARTEVSRTIVSLWGSAAQGAAELSAQTQAWLRHNAPWLLTAGRWVQEAGSQSATGAWTWVNEQGQALYRYTAVQLKAMWQAIQEATDMSWEMLKQVDWGQVLTCLAIGVAGVVLVITGAYVVYALGAAVFAALSALVGMVSGAGAAALASLALLLGVRA